VLHGKELEIEYEKKEIMDKINTFFGYNCISQVALKIVKEEANQKQNRFLKIKNFSKIDEKINKVNDVQLKSSLNNFLKAFNDKNR
jgi:hypothetical protein